MRQFFILALFIIGSLLLGKAVFDFTNEKSGQISSGFVAEDFSVDFDLLAEDSLGKSAPQQIVKEAVNEKNNLAISQGQLVDQKKTNTIVAGYQLENEDLNKQQQPSPVKQINSASYNSTTENKQQAPVVAAAETEVIAGPQGPPGPQGPTGPQGPAGPQGPQGPAQTTTLGHYIPNTTTQNFSGAVNTDHLNVMGNANIDGALTSQNLTLSNDLTVSGTIYGNVAGTINPQFTQGSVLFQGSNGLTEDNANFFWDDANNRLGIGTNNPTEKLEVNGNLKASNITTTDLSGGGNLAMTYIGHTQGQPIASGNYNSFVGFAAGASNTGAVVAAIGTWSAWQNSGTYVSGVGSQVLDTNSGNNVQAIGRQAASYNTGDNVNAIGFHAARANTGDNVTGIGYEAAASSTGANSILIGYQAGKESSVANAFILRQANINTTPLLQGDFSTGRLGINTSTPAATLTVQGTAGSPILNIFSSSGDSLIYTDSSGRTGINTNTPTAKLEINSAADSFANHSLLAVRHGDSDYASLTGQAYVGSSDYLNSNYTTVGVYGLADVYQSSGERATGPHGGKFVTIPRFTGTATTKTNTNFPSQSPSAVLGEVNLYTSNDADLDQLAGISSYLYLQGGGTANIDRYYGFSSAGFQAGAGFTFTDYFGYYARPTLVSDISNYYGYYSDVPLAGTIDNFYHFYGQGDYPSYFGGAVGIGTTTPTATLTVQGSAGSPILSIASSTGATIITVTEAGNVGIGTSTPISTLDVRGGRVETEGLGITGSYRRNSGSGIEIMYFPQLNRGDINVYNRSSSTFEKIAFGVSSLGILEYNASSTLAVSGNAAIGNSSSFSSAAAPTGGLLVQGKVGIATTTPAATLTVQGSAGSPILNIASSTGTSALYVDEFDRVGIGTTTPSYELDVKGAIRGTLGVINNNSGNGRIFINSNASTSVSDVVFQQEGTSMWSIGANDASGIETDFKIYNYSLGWPTGTALAIDRDTNYLGVSTTTPSYLLHVYRSTDGDVAGFTDANGTCTINPTNTALSCTSDSRLKKNISSLSGSLDKILGLNPVQFHWLNQQDDTARFGLIAQEVENIIPELVSTNQAGMKSVNYTTLLPFIIQAMQEQQVEIEQLQNQALLQGVDEGSGLSVFAQAGGEYEEIKLKKPILDEDSVGLARILPNDDKVEVNFSQAYSYPPLVQISPQGRSWLSADLKYTVAETTRQGFVIELNKPATDEMNFSWNAWASDQAKLFVSDNTSQLLNIEVVEGVDFSVNEDYTSSDSGTNFSVPAPATTTPTSSAETAVIEKIIQPTPKSLSTTTKQISPVVHLPASKNK